ncbi:MAG: drug/metabolite transporter (DMT)-like permease [Gammaproteobacteria bacterium]
MNALQVHCQVLLSRVLVATSFTVGAAITHGLEPAALTLLRFALASVLFAPYVYWRHGLRLPGGRAMLGYAAISASIVGFFWLMFEALRHTSALNGAAIHTLVPGLSALYAFWLVGEKLRRGQVFALALGLVGALWVVFRGDVGRALALEIGIGDVLFFLGCLSMGLYTPLVGRFHRGEPAAVMSFWVLVCGTLWLLLLTNVRLFEVDWANVPGRVYGGVAYLAVFTTLLTFFIQQHATVRLGPTRVAAYSYLTPLLVVCVEWALGHGLPNASTFLGIFVIITAIFWVQRSNRSET